MTIILMPLTGEVADIVEKNERPAYAQGYGLYNLAYGGGVVAGPLVASYIRDTAGWNVLTLTLGCLSVLSAAVVGMGATRQRQVEIANAV